MTKINYQALREAAEKATCGEWSLEYGESRFDGDDALIHREVAGYIPICRIEGAHPESGFDEDFQMEQQANAEFIAAANPATVLALLDERERNQQYIKRRDQENKEIALTVGKLLIENGRLVADTLRHLADNEIDSDYFAITSTNENGTEIDHEMAITDYALQAAGTVDELVAALESAEKRIAELESNEVREVGNQFLVVRHPGKTPVIKHCTGDLEEFLRKLIEQDPLVTIDIITHRYYGIGGQWVQDAVEYLHMMSDAGIRIKGGE
ncbi:ead/Ea22-like family protein [Escherichia coli]|nr:ead/Ea22-like family protein [Escherichia coli]EEV1921494.1 ead/Ea22-like family protein [Escherichia coli]EFU2307150.1 ead/Ea22-like family protein [Escherichia coli]EGN7620309.1 ead/Ea22-like family protein [Escherichia coli]EGP7587236.1 ead/Ea22-like family protein [Escherichia coli]